MSDGETIELPETTVPAGLTMSIQGFTSEDAAKELGYAVLDCIKTLGRVIDLSTLDGVTIAIDYDAALANLDRGLDGLKPLTRSDSAEMQGVAMSTCVMRGNQVKTHLIFKANVVEALTVEGASAEDIQQSIGIIAHECAHVQINALKELSIPDARLGAQCETYERGVLFQIAEICWDEYAVCRFSAPFAKSQNEQHAEVLIAVVSVARDRSNEAFRSYRLHADDNRLVGEAGRALCEPLKAVSYLLGGLDGADESWADWNDARLAVEAAGYEDLVDELHQSLRELWETQQNWDPTRDTFSPLLQIVRRVFESEGIYFRTESDGLTYIDLAFRNTI